MSDRKWEMVAFVHNPVQAEILKGLLEAQGIMIHLVREGYQAALGLGSQPSVRIEILAPNDQAEEARIIIADYNAGKFEAE